MVRKQYEWPERGELVVGTVVRVNPFSAFVALDEYNKKEGMIHISEVARKWIKDIRDFVKEGKRVVALVMRVDEEKRHIALSIKRVNKRSAEERLKEYKREQKAEKMLALIAKNNKISLDKAYDEIGFPLQSIFGEMFKAFQMSLTSEGYELLIKKGLPEKWAKQIKEVAETQMEIKEKSIKGILELKCPTSDGVESIKKVLKKSEKKGFEIRYISTPKYSISLKTKDAKRGQKELQKAADTIISELKKLGGEGSFEVE